MIKHFINVIEQVYKEQFKNNYMPEQLGVSEQLLSVIRQLAEQEEELIFDELAVETIDSVVDNIKKYHDNEDIIEMLEANINDLETEIQHKYNYR